MVLLFREGVPVDPKPRLVKCYNFTVIEFVPPKLTFELSCSKGFYVRSLVHDLGIGECMNDFYFRLT